MTLPAQVFNAISYCHAFRTIDEHVADLARGNPGARGQEGTIRNILQSVIDGGLMQSAAEISSSLEPVEAAPVAENPVIGVLTCDRPQSLERLLKSILGNCDLARVDSIVVYDDSRAPDSITENAKAIATVSKELEGRGHAPVLHYDPRAAGAVADAIVESVPGAEGGVRMLLDRRPAENQVTTGMGHNHCMLLSVGKPLLVFDDDILCDVHEAPVCEPGVAFNLEPRPARFYPSNEDWARFRAREDTCPVRRHMQVLGQGLRQSLHLLDRAASPDSFEHAALPFAQSLGEHSWVGVTQCGSFGDPGTGGNQWLASLDPESRADLLSLADGFDTALLQRNCWLGKTRPTYQMAANMSQLIGLDNRRYLPPRFPWFRGHDKGFGALTAFAQPDLLVLDLPFALPHLPIPPRQWKASDNTFSVRFSPFDHLCNYLIQRAYQHKARDPAVRNQALAALFADLADWPVSALVEMYASDWFLRKSRKILGLQGVLEQSASAPAEWRDYVEGAIAQCRNCEMPDFESVLLEPQLPGQEDLTMLEFCKKAWMAFAEGISRWPKVREVAVTVIADQVPNWSSASRE